MTFDPHASWKSLEQRAAAEADPAVRQLLVLVRDHMEHEIHGRLEPLMATLTAEPVYHLRGNGPPMVLRGQATVRGFYAAMFERGGEQFEVVSERIFADRGGVVTEGRVRQAWTAAAVQAAGITEVDARPVATGEWFLSDARLITVWPAAADGRLLGEDIYFAESPLATLARISRDDLPAYYRIV